MVKNSLLAFALCALISFSTEALSTETALPQRIDSPHQLEAVPFVGSLLGASVGQTFIAGVHGYSHLDSSWSLGGTYGYAPLYSAAKASIPAASRSARLHLLNAEALYSNRADLHLGQRTIPTDLYFTFGVGSISIGGSWQPLGVIKLPAGKSLVALRVDVNNYIHPTTKLSGSQIDFDVAFLAGLVIQTR